MVNSCIGIKNNDIIVHLICLVYDALLLNIAFLSTVYLKMWGLSKPYAHAKSKV